MTLLAAGLASGCFDAGRHDPVEVSSGGSDDSFVASIDVPDGESASIGMYVGKITYPDGRTFEVSAIRRGSIVDQWFVDLGGNEYPELIIWMVEVGSGSYASVHLYWMTEDGPRFEDMTDLPEPTTSGYMGHDSLSIAGNKLRRCYPTYETHDTNFEPTGEMQCLVFNSMMGWVLD